MNQQQRKYAIERVEKMANDKQSKIKKNLITPGHSLGKMERIELIRNNSVKIKSSKQVGKLSIFSLNDISNVFDFSNYEWPETFDDTAYKKKAEAINEKSAIVKDEIMLGDAEEALKLIEKFKKFKA